MDESSESASKPPTTASSAASATMFAHLSNAVAGKDASLSFGGRKALVTGAGKGIGKTVAGALVKCGCVVVGVARTAEDLEACKREFGANFVPLVADLSDAAACSKAGADAWALGGGGGVDLVVNCAGTGATQKFLDVTVEAWDTVMNVNCRAAMFVTQAVAKKWAEAPAAPGRAVVNVSSVPSGIAGMPERAAYCSSKGALNQLTRVMALELGASLGVRVNAVSPTVTMTPMGREAWADPAKSGPMLAHIPLGRFPEPSDVADAVLWLLSDACKMVHGANLPVDGGYSAIGGACLPLSD
jgi:NAD(P)-dependent dehydrogenase (short-subunit alcohol dehydrogenase family)